VLHGTSRVCLSDLPQAAHVGATVDIETYGIVNITINTIVNALQGESWDRLLSRFAVRFGLNHELTRSVGWARTCCSTSSQGRRSLLLSLMDASVKLPESIYTTSPNFLQLLLRPSPVRQSGRRVEWEKGSHDPPNKGSWTVLESPRGSTCPPPH